MKISIDGREVSVAEDKMLIELIREQGIEVPSMCYMKDLETFTSCMVCVVKDRRSGKMLPSCSLKPEEGMDLITDDNEVREARRTALELLLSEHVGDCEAPCQLSCPAHMDIPLMNRLLARGDFSGALQVVKKDIALPAVLGRICSAPCEGACRRRTVDEAVSICLLKRYAGDHDLEGGMCWNPERAPESGKKVTVIGAGPAGLSAAYYLSLKGHSVVLLDRNEKPGGSLRKEPGEALPPEVLDAEIGGIRQAGVEMQLGSAVDAAAFAKLKKTYDAVVVATGKGDSGVQEWGLDMDARGIAADGKSFRVADEPVFVAGSAWKPVRMAIRALGQGKELAFSVDQYLRGEEVRGEPRMFNSRFGKLVPAEFTEYLKESVSGRRLEPLKKAEGFTKEQVRQEAARCLHCDCRDLQHCKLRIYADGYGADQKRFRSEERSLVTKSVQHDLVIYEPSKCIKCGICVRLTEKKREAFGMTFIGRGFDVVVDIPFSQALDKGLQQVALEVADTCPTGAISRREDHDH
jgi:NADPH-dependent glutamate synthase beta subunit-like oxidoreductase/ferredoxin